MVDVIRKMCDVCHSQDEVAEIMVAPRWDKVRPWAVDLCPSCYQDRFGDLFRSSHPVQRSNIKPQLRIKETVISEKNL